jgi:quercetin dioxygenase-like cupin family protein
VQKSGEARPETGKSQTKVALKMKEILDQHEAPAIARAEPPTHHAWEEGCDGWLLVEASGLRVREECNPPGAAERPHVHRAGQQAFDILSGALTVQLPSAVRRFGQGDLLHIPAGVAYQVRNDAVDPVRFLVMTAPAADGDREETPALSGEPTR